MSRMRAEAESRWTQDDDEVPPRSAAAEAGSAFWDLVDKHSRLGPPVPRVLEIGPGLGRLLRAMLERNRPFQSYHGVELNRGHVDRLRGEFLDTRISFQAEDCARYDYPDWYDAVVSSSTFEHLFPSITATVTRLRDRVKTGGKLFADYPAGDEQMTVARSRFADHPARHWVRTYSRAELEQIYRQAGFMIDAVELYPAATDTEGGTVRRAFVAATASAE
jgi:SAM-dependent methyltransferase